MTSPLPVTFAGIANGSAYPAGWQRSVNNGDTWTVVDERGRYTPAVDYSESGMLLPANDNEVDVLFEVGVVTAAEWYVTLAVEASGLFSLSPNSGYFVELRFIGGNGNAAFYKKKDGVLTSLAPGFIDLPAFTAIPGRYLVRFSTVSNIIGFKVWPKGQNEPTTWMKETPDETPLTGGGYFTSVYHSYGTGYIEFDDIKQYAATAPVNPNEPVTTVPGDGTIKPDINGLTGNFSLLLNEEFNGTSLNTQLWTDHEPHYQGPPYYTFDATYPVPADSSVLQVANGQITFKARRDPNVPTQLKWKTAQINTRNKWWSPEGDVSVIFEADMFCGSGLGTSPQWWLEGDDNDPNNPSLGWSMKFEIDINEMFNVNTGYKGIPHTSFHWPKDYYTTNPIGGTKLNDYHVGFPYNPGGSALKNPDGSLALVYSWHRFTLWRTKNWMRSYVDGVLYKQVHPGETFGTGTNTSQPLPAAMFTGKMFLRLGLGVAGSSDASNFAISEGQPTPEPGWQEDDLGVRYVRVFQEVNFVNQGPVVNAGVDQSVISGNTVTLTGTANDPDGTIVSSSWTLGKPSGSAAVLSGTGSTRTFVADIAGTYTGFYTATDNSGATVTDTVAIVVTAAPSVAIPKAFQNLGGGAGYKAMAIYTGVLPGASSTPVTPPVTGTVNKTAKIMPMGDSLTAVDNSSLGFKGILLDSLTAGSYVIDYVGSKTATGPSGLKDFQHQGTSGAQNSTYLGQYLETVTAGDRVTTHQPDVVIYMVGTNDIWSNVANATAISRLRQVMDLMYAAKPGIHVVLCKTALMNVGKEAARIEYNNALNTVYTDYIASGKKMTLVDISNTLTLSDLQTDGIHWTSAGHQKVAAVLLDPVKAAVEGMDASTGGGSTGGSTVGTTSTDPLPFPDKAVGLYHMMWSNSGSPQLSTTPAEVNIIFMAFAQSDPPALTGWASQTETSFVNDAKALRARGCRIFVSVGGAGGALNVGNRQAFVNGIMAINARVTIDGIDWDPEGPSMVSADVLWIVAELKRLRGPNFSCTMAPNGSNKTQYRTVALALHAAGHLDMIAQQYYDTEVSQSTLLDNLTNFWVNQGIPQNKLGIGYMIGTGVNYWTVATSVSRTNAAKAVYPNLKGGYLWEAGRAGTAQWATEVGTILKG